jgi:hypothetical protein
MRKGERLDIIPKERIVQKGDKEDYTTIARGGRMNDDRM